RRYRVRIVRLELTDEMTNSALGSAVASRVQHRGSTQWSGQVDHLVAKLRIDLKRRRQRMIVREAKRCAVRKYTRGAEQTQFTDSQQIRFELEIEEAPPMPPQRQGADVDVALEVALLLLEMLGAKKQTFRPDDLGEARHD